MLPTGRHCPCRAFQLAIHLSQQDHGLACVLLLEKVTEIAIGWPEKVAERATERVGQTRKIPRQGAGAASRPAFALLAGSG